MSPLHRAMFHSRGLLHSGLADCAVIGSVTLHDGMQEVMSMFVKLRAGYEHCSFLYRVSRAVQGPQVNIGRQEKNY